MHEPSPRVDDLAALLRDLDALRLTVSTDMSLAAAALDAGAPGVAASVVDGDRAALLAFEQRALRHLAMLEEQARPAQPAAVPVLPRPRSRSRAARALLPAGPLLAAAAALLGVLGASLPDAGSADVTTRPASASTAAAASYAELQQLSRDGADDARVRRAAERLQSELEGIVAAAASDPLAAQQALALLEHDARVLDGLAGQDALSQVIADVRALVARLKAALPAGPRTPRAPTLPLSPAEVRAVAPPELPGEPTPVAQTAEPSAAPSPQAEPSPEASEQPSPQPSSASPSAPPSGPSGEAALPGLSDEG